jgi:hypothetical protein
VRAFTLVAALLAYGVLSLSTAAAQSAGAYPCGRVTEYRAPTATTSGSITIGTNRFELAPGSAPDREIAVGQDLCIDGDRNSSGAFTRTVVTPMGPGVCGSVTGHTPATATQRGSLTLSSPSRTYVVPVAAGTTFTPEQVSGGQCFSWRVNAEGNAEVFGHTGRWEGATSPSATPRTLPSTTSDATSTAAVAVTTKDEIAPRATSEVASGPMTLATTLTLALLLALVAAIGVLAWARRRA